MSIPTDDNTPTDTGLSDQDAVAQLMASIAPQGDSDEAEEEEDQDLDDEDQDEDDDSPEDDEDEPEEVDEDEQSEEAEEEPEADEKPAADDPPPPTEASDDAKVKVSVDGQETEFTVGQLKRLAGQEAALTRKSQEADVVGSRAATVLRGALEIVLEDLDAYKDVDWMVAQQDMEPEEFRWHRENYTRLTGRYSKLIGAAKEFDTDVTAAKARQRQEKAADALKVLSDPTTGITDWSDDLYGSIIQYGIDQGLDGNDVRQIAEPSVIKLLHKAMQYDKLQADRAKAAKAVTEKVKAAPKRVKSGSGREAPAATDRSVRTLEKKLQTGRATDQDAQALLMGRWGVRGR